MPVAGGTRPASGFDAKIARWVGGFPLRPPKSAVLVGGSGGKWRRLAPVFLGEFQHALDDKGRLIIPARFRDGLGERFIVTRGLDQCLFAYPEAEWQVLESRLKSLPLTKADARAFVRFLFSGAYECEPDRQGRIMLPAGLRQYAGLEKDVAVIGVSTRVEIWAAERWAGYVAKAGESFGQIAENLEGLGL